MRQSITSAGGPDFQQKREVFGSVVAKQRDSLTHAHALALAAVELEPFPFVDPRTESGEQAQAQRRVLTCVIGENQPGVVRVAAG